MARRTCVVCRKADEQTALMRFALRSNPSDPASAMLEADLKRRLPGRGLYVHRQDCLHSRQLEKLLISGFSRALARGAAGKTVGKVANKRANARNVPQVGDPTRDSGNESECSTGHQRVRRIIGLSEESKELLGRNARANNNGVHGLAGNGERAPKRKIRL